jgi:hypothetical protein
VHPETSAPCTAAADKVAAFAPHYQVLFMRLLFAFCKKLTTTRSE